MMNQQFGMHFVFFFNYPATTEIYTLSLHDALPISLRPAARPDSSLICTVSSRCSPACDIAALLNRSEEHTSELQSRRDLVCRLLLEKKKMKYCWLVLNNMAVVACKATLIFDLSLHS